MHLEECQQEVKLKNIIFIKHCVSPPRGSSIPAADEVMGLAGGGSGVLGGVLGPVSLQGGQSEGSQAAPPSSGPEFRYNLSLSEIVLRS